MQRSQKFLNTLRFTMLVAGLALANFARADGIGDALGFSPFWDWQTIESPHFRVTYPKGLEKSAQDSTKYFEQAHALLTDKLKWTPYFKTQVVIVDNLDAANGMASTFGRFGMVLMVTPPENWFSTSYYENWLQLVCFHEYTHFVNMDTARGFFMGLRFVFGDVLLPNTFWPGWMLEGLAVYEETRLTRGGRGRSPYYEMILRSAQLENKLGTPDFVSLDKLTGTNPYFPGGEMDYMFGYQLMNQVASQDETYLGEMSYRSGKRFPYFINGNLENITGKDWYQTWDDWVALAKTRADRQIKKIKSHPVTVAKKITNSRYSVQGAAISPDGKWLAYSEESLEKSRYTWVRNRTTGVSKVLDARILGVALTFTPDSKTIVLSQLHRKSLYEYFSDLQAIEFESGHSYWLSEGLRARDPDISKDGKWITFSITGQSRTGIALAPLATENGKLKLGAIKTLFMPEQYDASASPKFDRTGTQIVFSFHKNGKFSEEIMAIDLKAHSVTTLVSNSKFNRFPVFDPANRLHYVSDLNGVDNIYRRVDGRSQQVTNLLTGAWFPTFAPSGEAFASVNYMSGWELAEVPLSAKPYPTADLTIDAPNAPPTDPATDQVASSMAKTEEYPSSSYSLYPSILPRQWFPLLLADVDSVVVGGQASGFDALDVHRYVLGATYDSGLKTADWVALYSTRIIGPTLTFLGYQNTGYIKKSLNSTEKSTVGLAAISYPFLFDRSIFYPSLSFMHESHTKTYPSTGSTLIVNDIDLSTTLRLQYGDAEDSRLAITPEKGRSSMLGIRAYDNRRGAAKSIKTAFSDTEHFELGKHHVLVPTIRGAYVPHKSSIASESNVEVSGRSRSLFADFTDDEFDTLRLRGYPRLRYQTQSVGIGSVDYRFPIAQIFRGLGTNPYFLNQISGFFFGEAAVFPQDNPGSRFLPSIGGGVKATSEIFLRLPFSASLEYHKGLNTSTLGRSEALLRLGISADLGL